MQLPDIRQWILPPLLLASFFLHMECVEAEAPSPVVSKASTPISIEFEDASLTSVVKTFSRLLDKNIVILEGQERQVTVRLRKVPALTAFRAIVRSEGLLLREEAGIFYIIEQKSLVTTP